MLTERTAPPVVINWDAFPRLFWRQLYRQTGSAVYSRQSKERRLNLRRQEGAVRSVRIYSTYILWLESWKRDEHFVTFNEKTITAWLFLNSHNHLTIFSKHWAYTKQSFIQWIQPKEFEQWEKRSKAAHKQKLLLRTQEIFRDTYFNPRNIVHKSGKDV